MKVGFFGTVCALVILFAAIAAPAAEREVTGGAVASPGKDDMSRDLRIWFDQPAAHYTASLPLGNGRQGAMVFGGVESERIVLNEISLWSGMPHDSDREKAHAHLPEIRRLLAEGKNTKAQALVMEHFICKGPGSSHGNAAVNDGPYGCYQTLGDLLIEWEPRPGDLSDYARALDLATATASVRYRLGDVGYTEDAFVSAPDQAVVVRLRSDKPGAVSFTARLRREERFETTAVSADTLVMKGRLSNGMGGDGMRYATHLRIVPEGGVVEGVDDGLRVTGADGALLFVTAATDSKWPEFTLGADPEPKSASYMDAVSGKAFDKIRDAHVADFQKYSGRVGLTLSDGDSASVGAESLPTDARLRRLMADKDARDPALAALFFQFGRYLLISSSRPGGLPANLQGLWAEEIQTPWNGDYHLDINVQMNYWPAESTNLGELHEPLIRLVESLQEPGAKTARAYYDVDGWVAHVITNVWGYTSPGEHASWGSTVSGAGWLCQHLWEHYAFNPDKAYLERVYPVLKGSAQAFLGMLMEEPRHNWLVTAPSNSPENTFITAEGRRCNTCMGPTVDMQILRELFGNCIEASRILGVDEGFRSELERTLGRLAPNQIGKHGQLQEWLEDYDEADPLHRHVSHLYGLYPGAEITPDGTPELAEAARKTLVRRGDAGVGWSLAWKIGFWARLQDGDHALDLLDQFLTLTDEQIMRCDGGGGVYANLFCAGPPFQIEGNFGAAAGIAEMLMQSHGGLIRILPALPARWKSGKVTGLCARGGFTVDVEWASGDWSAEITSRRGLPCRIAGPETLSVCGKDGESVAIEKSGAVTSFETEAGSVYMVRPAQ